MRVSGEELVQTRWIGLGHESRRRRRNLAMENAMVGFDIVVLDFWGLDGVGCCDDVLIVKFHHTLSSRFG